MFTEFLEGLNHPLTNFALYAPCSDREAWNTIDSDIKAKFVALGEEYLHFSYPALSATDFLDFTRTGNRVRYEDKFFSKRLALSSLVIAECLENKGRFMDDIINGIFSICEESGWQLPSHNTYVRDTIQLPLPDLSRPLLDLFACETGAILSTTLYLLEEKLNEYSPIISQRIRDELKYRVLTPYLSCHFWWMGNDQEPMNNWTIWCTQNILITAFLSGVTSDYHAIIKKSCQSIDYFLAEYATDGCCDEGAQYYRHAGLCLFNSMEILNAATDNYFLPLYQNAKIQNIATYIMHVHINDKYYLNYADCSPVAGRAGIREYLFAKSINNLNMMNFAVKDFFAGNDETLLLSKENNLYYRLQTIFTLEEIHRYNKTQLSPVAYEDVYFPSTGIFVARKGNLYLSVKAGCNNDGHNHNDTGSFIIYKHGQPLFIDVGVESYTKKTFSDRRYEIWTMQSDYHNLPTIGTFMQKDGAEYKAENITYSFGEKKSYIGMNLESAYPKEAELLTYKRHVSLSSENNIMIQDSFSFINENLTKPVILNFMTYETPCVTADDKLLTIQIGTLGSMKVKGGSLLTIDTIPITDARLKQAWKHDIYRIRINVISSTIDMQIS